MSSHRLGWWAAIALVAIGVAYTMALAAAFARHGLSEPIVDPILAIMEILTLLWIVPFIVLMAAIHEHATPERRIFAVVALAFAIMLAGTTAAVHFAGLTSGRQLGGGGIAWPSSAYAIELLAWNLFLGVALVFAAPVFAGTAGARAVRRALVFCGTLCIAGIAGPVAGDMRLQLVGVVGYVLVLPVVCVMIARLFKRAEAAATS